MLCSRSTRARCCTMTRGLASCCCSTRSSSSVRAQSLRFESTVFRALTCLRDSDDGNHVWSLLPRFSSHARPSVRYRVDAVYCWHRASVTFHAAPQVGAPPNLHAPGSSVELPPAPASGKQFVCRRCMLFVVYHSVSVTAPVYQSSGAGAAYPPAANAVPDDFSL